jgi:acyl-coenzyme A thioesterase PaaI-like protein
MISSFDVASAVERVAENEFVAQIPDGWQQGRGAFGGLVLGTMLRAMEKVEPEAARVARTLSGDLCGPVLPGEARIVTEVLRRGKNQTNVRASLRQDGNVIATTTAVLSAPRKAALPPRTHARPPVAPWEGVDVAPIGPPLAPVFAQHFEYRNTGPVPFVGGKEALAAGWIRPRVAPAKKDAPMVVALLDTWWPALLATTDGPRAVATISFTAEFLFDATTLTPEEPLHHVARVDVVQEGFFVEFRELWSARGDLVAMNQQTMALLG